jgi:DNA-binding response OmpR family regulator
MSAVLLNVDDHEGTRYARNRILSSAGFCVHNASNGEETLALSEKHHPDLILLDVHLPDFSGIEVCRRLKQSQRNSSVMVLQISASALSAAHAKEALDAGADAYLAEPVDPDVLVATVKALFACISRTDALNANRQLEIANKEQRSNQDLQHFAFAASHDLQNPSDHFNVHRAVEQELKMSSLSNSRVIFDAFSAAGPHACPQPRPSSRFAGRTRRPAAVDRRIKDRGVSGDVRFTGATRGKGRQN